MRKNELRFACRSSFFLSYPQKGKNCDGNHSFSRNKYVKRGMKKISRIERKSEKSGKLFSYIKQYNKGMCKGYEQEMNNLLKCQFFIRIDSTIEKCGVRILRNYANGANSRKMLSPILRNRFLF